MKFSFSSKEKVFNLGGSATIDCIRQSLIFFGLQKRCIADICHDVCVLLYSGLLREANKADKCVITTRNILPSLTRIR